ncbi:PQQ-like beta-propeller repeat protein [candidate division KSB1 bacterium]|nr:PQQ-like beta-propeller repeat protein [candidate division KSB1 bacterium]
MKLQLYAPHAMRKILLAAMAIVIAGAGMVFSQQPKLQKQKSATQANNVPEWPQWGGPQRNFKAEVKSLTASWPENGPRQLWRRALGEGHSSILVDNGKLYTMYSNGEREIVIALEAATGKTIWEHTYESPKKGLDLEYGSGPHATPLIAGDLLYTAGATAKLLALNKQTGKVVWSHDLWKEFGGTEMDRGYSCSPLAYKNTVIVTVGGSGQALMAFDQKNGSVVWKNQNFDNSPASPTLINVDGEDQLVAFMANEIAGLNPNNGELLWSHPHKTSWGLNISTPVWGEDNLLFCSSAYGTGSRALQLTRMNGKTIAKEIWTNNKMHVHFGTVIRAGDHIYGSSGDFGPCFFTAIEAKTGKILWQNRGLARASFVYADGKFIILDEEGNLALATASPEGLKVHAKVDLLSNKAWTAPTLVGKKLYARDRKEIVALELD